MANHKSAEKRARQNKKRNLRNKAAKTKMKNIIKAVKTNTEPQEAPKKLSLAQSVIAKLAKKGIIHKKNAARKVSRLYKLTSKQQQNA